MQDDVRTARARELERAVLRHLAERDEGLSGAALAQMLDVAELDVAMTLDALHRNVRFEERTDRWVMRAAPLPPVDDDARPRRSQLLRSIAFTLLGGAAGLVQGGAAGAVAGLALHGVFAWLSSLTTIRGREQAPGKIIAGFALSIPIAVLFGLAILSLMAWALG